MHVCAPKLTPSFTLSCPGEGQGLLNSLLPCLPAAPSQHNSQNGPSKTQARSWHFSVQNAPSTLRGSVLGSQGFLSSVVFPEQHSEHGKPSINSHGMNKSLNKGTNEESQFRWSNVMKKVNRLESPCEARQAGCFF